MPHSIPDFVKGDQGFQTPSENKGEYVECQACFTPFKTEVLQYSHSMEKEQQLDEQGKKLLAMISDELDGGMPLQVVAKSIVEAGASQEIAARILYIATQGKIKVCGQCKNTYKATLQYCGTCGSKLPPVESY